MTSRLVGAASNDVAFLSSSVLGMRSGEMLAREG